MAARPNRQRVHVGRQVTYRPTDAQAAAGGGAIGDAWIGQITAVQATGTATVMVWQANGAALVQSAISRGSAKGTFDTYGAGSAAV